MAATRLVLAWLAVVGCGAAGASVVEFDDPLASDQWYHDPMNFGEAWATVLEQPRRGQVIVGVLDSGFQTDHPDLSANLLPGLNIVDGSTDVSPVHPHGTGTGGIPGALSGNGQGISQTALTAHVLPIRISNRSDGAAYISDIAAAIRTAADGGARVINVSYGGVGNREIARAARYAYRKGALTFMAAGNSGFETRWRNHRHLIAVGSVDQDNERSYFSTYGRFVDFVAPGEQVKSLYTDGRFVDWSGTSFAAPIAASVAGLVLAANPELSPAQLLRIMKKSTTDLGRRGRDKEYGWGLPDAEAAVALALQTRGAYARRYRRQGIDPYVANEGYPFGGVLPPDPLPTFADSGLDVAGMPLAEPQGFVVPALHDSGLTFGPQPLIGPPPSVTPEPAGAPLLLVGAGLAGLRRTRSAARRPARHRAS